MKNKPQTPTNQPPRFRAGPELALTMLSVSPPPEAPEAAAVLLQ